MGFNNALTLSISFCDVSSTALVSNKLISLAPEYGSTCVSQVSAEVLKEAKSDSKAVSGIPFRI